MSTRLAAGLISDLANSIGQEILHYLPSIAPLLWAILQKNDFDPEAKLVSIIAFGDLALAAGPEQFVQYLPETQTSFFSASSLSLNIGSSPEE